MDKSIIVDVFLKIARGEPITDEEKEQCEKIFEECEKSREYIAMQNYIKMFGEMPGTYDYLNCHTSEDLTKALEECVSSHLTFGELTGYSDIPLSDDDIF